MCDPCVFVKNDSSSKVFIMLYVDDLLVTGSSEACISKTKAFLMTKFAMRLRVRYHIWYVCIYVHMYVCTRYVCMSVCIYVCMYVCMYV